MNAPDLASELIIRAEEIEFTLDGKKISAYADQSLIEIAKQNGIDIPHLCYKPGYRADGNCRACVVEIKGERVLAPSCCRYPANGMIVATNSPRAEASQKMVLELLRSDAPPKDYKPGAN